MKTMPTALQPGSQVPPDADGRVGILYQTRSYPAMSHPRSDPAVTVIAAALAGLRAPDPRRARVLEIGCASGHNLLPLARRWPGSDFFGMDLSAAAVATARDMGAQAGLGNVMFSVADIRTFDPGPEPFDHIIAHGVFSWVSDDAKSALLDFCRRHLAANGTATISFNLADGWAMRRPLVDLARQIMAATGEGPAAALAFIRGTLDPSTPHGAHVAWLVDDMLEKGEEMLSFDEFGPVCDPWRFDDFVQAAARAGLRWLGESDPAENLPSSLRPAGRQVIAGLAHSPMQAQLAGDFAAGRSFRSGVLCRDDAPLEPSARRDMLLSCAYRAGGTAPSGKAAAAIHERLRAAQPRCVAVGELRDGLSLAPAAAENILLDGVVNGHFRPRLEAVSFDPAPPPFPKLPPLGLICAKRGLPVVDIWHVPCGFPVHHYAVLEKMDGSLPQAELERQAATLAPDLDFIPWLRHLAGRGFFAC